MFPEEAGKLHEGEGEEEEEEGEDSIKGLLLVAMLRTLDMDWGEKGPSEEEGL